MVCIAVTTDGVSRPRLGGGTTSRHGGVHICNERLNGKSSSVISLIIGLGNVNLKTGAYVDGLRCSRVAACVAVEDVTGCPGFVYHIPVDQGCRCELEVS